MEARMPNLILLMTRVGSELMTDSVFHAIRAKMEGVVVEALPDIKDVLQIGTYEVVAKRTHNVSAMQIICMASLNDERLAQLVPFKSLMGQRLVELGHENLECRKYFKTIGRIEVWPIMPEGKWGNVLLGAM